MGYSTSMSGKIYSFYRQWSRSLKVHCYSFLATGNWSSDLAAQEKMKNSNETKAVSQVLPSVSTVISKEQPVYHCMDGSTLLVLLGPCLGVKSYAKKSLFTPDRAM